MQASEALAMHYRLKSIQTGRSDRKGKHTRLLRSDQKSSPRQTVGLLEKLMANYMAFLEFAHSLWEASKPTNVLTDNKSVNRFFQTKAVPSSLWMACDYVLQFSFKIARIFGSVETAADFFSRLDWKIKEIIRRKIR